VVKAMLLLLLAGCDPATLIITEMDYGDAPGKLSDPDRDEDGDGYSAAEDCDDTDPLVYPDALEICNAVDDNCDSQIDEEEVCPCETREHGDSLYAFCQEEEAWEMANETCLAAGMELVKIERAEEQAWLVEWLEFGDSNSWYIGLNDRTEEGVWRWTDGTELGWDSWNAGEPNDYGDGEDCVELRWDRDNWNDVSCSNSRPFVCEFN
jgi:hypothetical protein